MQATDHTHQSDHTHGPEHGHTHSHVPDPSDSHNPDSHDHGGTLPHGHSHHHTHDHHDAAQLARTPQWRISVAIALGLVTVITQIIVGLLSGSLALLSDSAHAFTDVFGLCTALIAIRIGARTSATPQHTFGFRRVEVLAAGFNAVLLLAVAVIIVVEAVERLIHPVDVLGLPVAIVAVVGLLMNFFAFLAIRGGKDESINVKGAYLEVMADMVGSVGVLISGLITYLTGWVYADIVVAVLIALWVLPRAVAMLRQVSNVILQGTPTDVDVESLRHDILSVDGVQALHHFHVWSLTTGDNIGSVHVVTSNPQARRRVQELMEHTYSLHHVTVQAETPAEQCSNVGACV